MGTARGSDGAADLRGPTARGITLTLSSRRRSHRLRPHRPGTCLPPWLLPPQTPAPALRQFENRAEKLSQPARRKRQVLPWCKEPRLIRGARRGRAGQPHVPRRRRRGAPGPGNGRALEAPGYGAPMWQQTQPSAGVGDVVLRLAGCVEVWVPGYSAAPARFMQRIRSHRRGGGLLTR